RGPFARETGPMPAGGRVIRRQLCELGADLVERQAEALGEDDEGDPSQHPARVATVAPTLASRPDQAPVLVEAERRGRDAPPSRNLAECEEAFHAAPRTHPTLLPSSSLELVEGPP